MSARPGEGEHPFDEHDEESTTSTGDDSQGAARGEGAGANTPGGVDDEAIADLAGLEDALDSELARAIAQRDEYLDALRRLQAEFENFRKRTARQQSEQLERANLGLLERLLPVLDAFDLALAHALASQGDGDEDVKAFGQIASLLRDVLAKDGLERIDAVGVAFDPEVHDAVAHLPGDDAHDEEAEAGPSVAEVLRAGYRLKGRVLRPAMVSVQG